ncbi:MAG: hypothetical protein ABH859_02180 [Pseudomonadota bacterium]
MNNTNSWDKAKKYGVDTSLLEVNLKKSPTERVITLQNAVALANSLQQAGSAYYAKLRKTHKKTSRS